MGWVFLFPSCFVATCPIRRGVTVKAAASKSHFLVETSSCAVVTSNMFLKSVAANMRWAVGTLEQVRRLSYRSSCRLFLQKLALDRIIPARQSGRGIPCNVGRRKEKLTQGKLAWRVI